MRTSWRALLALATLLAAFNAVAEERFALIIGSNAGWANDRPLRHAEEDAERIRSVLVELGAFPADRTVLLRDPDTGDVRAHLRKLSQTLRSSSGDTLVVVYYSGHSDAKHLHLRGLPMGLDELYQAVRDLPASVRIGVLDSCRSGSILGAKGGSPAAPFEVTVRPEAIKGLAFLTSSGADELSQETRTLAGSVFTHHLASGLRGAADLDHDGKVTLSEVYRYAFQRTEADTTGTLVPQKPAFRFELKGQGDVILTQPSTARANLTLPPGDEHRYLVVDPQEWQLLAEGRSSRTDSVKLALAPGAYRVKRIDAEDIQVASLTLVEGSSVSAETLTYSSRPLSGGILKGQPDSLNPVELREFHRGEALKLLSEGEPGPALTLFAEILKSKPDDWPSLRGKSHALIRLASAYERVGDHEHERDSLRQALLADASLSEDPDFQNWYHRLQDLEGEQQRAEEIKRTVKEEIADNPRLVRRFGLGLDLLSGRGAFALVGTLLYKNVWFPYVSVDLIGPGVEVGIRLIPFASRWSPLIGIGARASFQTLGMGQATKSFVSIDGSPNGYQELFGKTLHADLGIQYFGPSGFSAEIGVAGMLYARAATGKAATTAMPSFNIGWYF